MNANFIDTNIVIYSFSKDKDKRLTALKLLAEKPIISIQVINESANILQKKLNHTAQETRIILKRLSQECYVVPISFQTACTTGCIPEVNVRHCHVP